MILVLPVIKTLIERNKLSFNTFMDNSGLEYIFDKLKIINEKMNKEFERIEELYEKEQEQVEKHEKEQKEEGKKKEKEEGVKVAKGGYISVYHALCDNLFEILSIIFISTWRNNGSNLISKVLQSPLPNLLENICKSPIKYSLKTYSISLSLFSSIIQSEPSCYMLVYNTGLIQQILHSFIHHFDLQTYISISQAIRTICLHKMGIEDMKNNQIIFHLLSTITGLHYLCDSYSFPTCHSIQSHQDLHFFENLPSSSDAWFHHRFSSISTLKFDDLSDLSEFLGSLFSSLVKHYPELETVILKSIFLQMKCISKYNLSNYALFKLLHASSNSPSQHPTPIKEQKKENEKQMISSLINNFAIFSENFFANYIPKFNNDETVEEWCTVLLNIYSRKLTSTLSNENGILIIFHTIAIKYLPILLRIIIGRLNELLVLLLSPNSVEYLDDFIHLISCFIGILEKLVEFSNKQQVDALSVLHSPFSIDTFHLLSSFYRITLWNSSISRSTSSSSILPPSSLHSSTPSTLPDSLPPSNTSMEDMDTDDSPQSNPVLPSASAPVPVSPSTPAGIFLLEHILICFIIPPSPHFSPSSFLSPLPSQSPFI